MNPGRELDALIADKLMFTIKDGIKWMDGNKKYSTDISAAWAIVEKLTKEGWKLSMSTWDMHGQIYWQLSFWKRHGYPTGDEVHNVNMEKSIEMAICVAALKAISS